MMLNTTIHHDEVDIPGDTYLTDGSHLYRVLDKANGVRTMVTVEDCLSLDIILIEAKSVARLRRVKETCVADGQT